MEGAAVGTRDERTKGDPMPAKLAGIDEGDPTGRFSTDLTVRLENVTIRKLADASGWGKTTVHDIKSGRRLPSPDQLVHLLTAAGCDKSEVDQWLVRRQSLPHVLQPSVTESVAGDVEVDDKDRAHRRGKRLRRLAGAAVLLLIVFAAGVGVGRLTAPQLRPTATESERDSRRSSGPVVASVKIANTSKLGVNIYAGPSRATGKVGAVPEGTEVKVVCQDGTGEPLTDTIDGEKLTWPVWDRLDDGTWVPDMYTALPKVFDHDQKPETVMVAC